MKPVLNGSWNYPSILAMVEGSNANMIKHMKKHEKSFQTLQKKKAKRRNSLLVAIADDKKAEEEAFAKLYNSKAASSYRKYLLQKIADVL